MVRWLATVAKGYTIAAILGLNGLSGPSFAAAEALVPVDSIDQSGAPTTVSVSLPNATSSADSIGESDEGFRSITKERELNVLDPRDDKPFSLRILPLGASITYGLRSTDGDGYREDFLKTVESDGWNSTMIGSVRAGTMKDNANEGHPGYRVDQVANVAEKDLSQKPNLILLNAGTNDAVQNYKINSISDRMNDLLDELYNGIPGTTILFSTLIPNEHAQKNIDKINQQYRKLEAKRHKAGDRIILAEMDNGNITTADLSSDGIHPTDEGYRKMAAIWWSAFESAYAQDMLQAPAALTITSNSTTTATGTATATATGTATETGTSTATATKHSLGRRNYHVSLLSMLAIVFSVLFLVNSLA